MSTYSKAIAYTSQRPVQGKYPVDGAADSILNGELVGIYVKGNAKVGQVLRYDDTVADLAFHGIAQSEAAADAEDSAISVIVDYSGLQAKRATVVGSESSAIGAPVYATSYDPDDGTSLTMTQPTAGVLPVAYLKEQSAAGSAVWKIDFVPSYAKSAEVGAYVPGELNGYTADGAIALPTEDNEVARLTGSSSAAMTLAVPGAAQLGFHFNVTRVAGSGTHDVDFTDEEGNAVTRVLLDGASLRLYAFSTTGWRILG